MQSWTAEITGDGPGPLVVRVLDGAKRLVSRGERDGAALAGLANEAAAVYPRSQRADVGGQLAIELVDLGRKLYRWLDGDGRALEVLDNDPEGALLRLVSANPVVRALPWELLHDGTTYLQQRAFPAVVIERLVRNQAQAEHKAANRPLHVLFMATSPRNVQPELAFEAEEAAILKATAEQGLLLDTVESGSVAGLKERLGWRGNAFYDVFHLSGHARLKEGQPVFLVEDDHGDAEEVGPAALRTLFGGRWPRLLFVSGCHTGEAGAEGVVPSFCEALVQQGARAVLGWGLPVYDREATEAASFLFGQLAEGRELDQALVNTRLELGGKNLAAWHQLRFYGDASGLASFVTAPGSGGRALPPPPPPVSWWLDREQTRQVCPPGEFVGRRRLLQAGLRTLRAQPGNKEYAEGLLLHGTAGLGKSSLCARLLDRLPDHQRIVSVKQLDEAGFVAVLGRELPGALRLVEDEAAQARRDAAIQAALAILGERGPLEERLVRMLAGPLQAVPLVFVCDDFEWNMREPTLRGGAPLVSPGALAVVRAVAGAIRRAAGLSRLIITSQWEFQLGDGLRLEPLPLASMRGAELEKKLAQLPAIGSRTVEVDPAARAEALRLADGNPRLLHWLDEVLRDRAVDRERLFAALEGKVG
jgi:hypothetical protein